MLYEKERIRELLEEISSDESYTRMCGSDSDIDERLAENRTELSAMISVLDSDELIEFEALREEVNS